LVVGRAGQLAAELLGRLRARVDLALVVGQRKVALVLRPMDF